MCSELGWITVDDHAPHEERDEYDSVQAVPFLAFGEDGEALGTARLIMPGPIPFPIERHFDLMHRSEIEAVHGLIGLSAEISRFIVPHHPRFKQHEITMTLCMALLGTLLGQDASHAFISADQRFFRLLKMLGFPFGMIGEPKVYLGSPTVPAIINLATLAERLRSSRPELYELMLREAQPAALAHAA
jgi:N-acyl-L-homoserine lactone synthetase